MSNLDFIVAKVRGMRGQIHEGPRLLPLCDIPNIRDLAATLAPGQPIGNTIGLQRYLTEQHIASLHGLLNVLDGWEAGLFLAMLRRYQAENLKVILRCWAAKTDEALLADILSDNYLLLLAAALLVLFVTLLVLVGFWVSHYGLNFGSVG